jgi:hypothetical protein
LVSGDGQIVSARLAGPGVGSEWKECHEASYLLSHHQLSQPNDEMESSFLCLPIGHRRARSEVRSEIGSIEDQTGAGQAVPRPAESTPDLRIGTSSSPSSRPLTPRDQKSKGMQTTFFQKIHLTTLFRATQIAPLCLIDSDPFSEWDKATAQNPQITLNSQAGNPPYMPQLS